MSTNLVIVAIPEETDRVWDISSEKIPHLTLLFLGDAESNPNLEQIMQFVQHATELSEHGPFYLDVDRRGELGEDKADVLFFSQRSWNLKWIKQFRGQLLQNQAVRTAYDSVQQFPEWNPHLTLGYPETPAKDPDNGAEGTVHSRSLYSVSFDRIGVWVGNYEGPDFKLEYPDREMDPFGDYPAIHTLGQTLRKPDISDVVEHFGVKGMRWGQTKSETITVPNFKKQTLTTKKVTPKKAAKLDARWEKAVGGTSAYVSVHNDAAAHVNSKIDGINAKFEKSHPKEFNDGTLLNSDHPVTKEYHKEYIGTLKEGLQKSVDSLSNSPTGKMKVKLVTENEDSLEEFGWRLDTEKVVHADSEDEAVFVYVAKRNAKGLITNIEPKEDAMAQSVELGEAFVLEHYGTKGMRWGIRKVRDARFHTKANSTGNINKLVAAASSRTRAEDLPRINAKYEAKGAKTHKNVHLQSLSRVPVQKQYREEVKAAYLKQLNAAASNTTNASGTKRYEIAPLRLSKKDPSATKWRVRVAKIEHADGEIGDEFYVVPIFDADGFIIDFKHEDVELEQSAADQFVTDFFAHYGTKGMKWGVRNSRGAPVAVTPHATSTVPHGAKRKTKVTAEGGENHPASEDALKVAAARVKLKKSGPATLSNKELREVAERMRLEAQVVEMNRSAGSRFVRKLFGNQGNQVANEVVREGVKEGRSQAKERFTAKKAA